MMMGLMDRCLAKEKAIDCLRENVKVVEAKLNELNAWKEVQVQKLTLTKKALELENYVDELRKVLLDKEGEITDLREQVRRAKANGKAEF